MSFVSFEFITLLLVSTLLYFIVPKKFRYLVLVLTDIIFYVYSSKIYSIYLLVSIISIYLGGIILNKLEAKKSSYSNLELEARKLAKRKIKKQKKLVLLTVVLINIGILLVLKYDNFFINIINSLFKSNISLFKFILPLGISYYTLEAISYIVDVYNGKYEASNNFFKVFLYLTFFPLMVEGPICRFDDLGESIYVGHDYNFERYNNGLLRIVWGFIKKLVIADRVGLFVDQVFNGGHSGIIVFLGIILYVIQIYTEFSGCMDIVIGSAILYGIDLPENFKEPLFSKSIGEFWRRWHITLGTWLKDYIFYPISLSKTNLNLSIKAHKRLPKFLADLITECFPLLFLWLIMGFWHGASWKYILYGLYYFLIMMLGILLKPVFAYLMQILHINSQNMLFILFQVLRTMLLICIGMTLFRASTFMDAINLLRSIFTGSSESIVTLMGGIPNIILIIFSLVIVLIIDIIKYKGHDILKLINKQNIVVKYAIYLSAIIFLLIFGIYGYGYSVSSFIYGEF